MITVTITNSDLQATLNDIRKYKKEVRDRVGYEIAKSAYKIQAEAFRNAPKRTTFMAKSISVILESSKSAAIIAVNAFYGIFVERGTSRQKAQPFLEPAAEKEFPNLINNIKKVIYK